MILRAKNLELKQKREMLGVVVNKERQLFVGGRKIWDKKIWPFLKLTTETKRFLLSKAYAVFFDKSWSFLTFLIL